MPITEHLKTQKSITGSEMNPHSAFGYQMLTEPLLWAKAQGGSKQAYPLPSRTLHFSREDLIEQIPRKKERRVSLGRWYGEQGPGQREVLGRLPGVTL